MPPFLLSLLNEGLSLLGNAALVKGKGWIKDATGVDLDAKTLSPEQILALRKFEADNAIELTKLRQEDDRLTMSLQEMYLKDRQDARAMQIAALAQSDWFAKHFGYIFALLWCFTAAVYVFAITFLTIPKDSLRFADTILGFLLGTVIAQIIGFYYGSSQHQKTQQEALVSLQSKIKDIQGKKDEPRT